MCLSAVGASQHRGQVCRGAPATATACLYPNTCGAFHGSGPSNFSGKLHIFHGHRKRTMVEAGVRIGGWSDSGGG